MAVDAAVINRRNKGASAEREVAKLLNGKWLTADGTTVTARRGQQFSGGPDSPDVVHNIPHVHLEVTRSYKVRPGTDAMTAKLVQAARDCACTDIPYVVWRPDGDRSWRVTFRAIVDDCGIVPSRCGPSVVTIEFCTAVKLWGLLPVVAEGATA